MSTSKILSAVTLACVAALPAAAGAQYSSRTHTETHGSTTVARQSLLAAASHSQWERGRLLSNIDYLGSSALAYDAAANAASGTSPFAIFTATITPRQTISGLLVNSGRRIVPATSGNLFTSDVMKSYWLTIGGYTVAGNVTATAAMDLWFGKPATSSGRWSVQGYMRASAQGTMRLVGSLGLIQSVAQFGQQELTGDFSMTVLGGWGGLTYNRGKVDLQLRIAQLVLFGATPSYRTLQSTGVAALQITPFLWFDV